MNKKIALIKILKSGGPRMGNTPGNISPVTI